MSGLAAHVRLDEAPVSAATMAPLAQALAPWGRDAQATWTADGEPAGLCSAVTVITPEDAFERQPMVSPDGRYVAVAHCRLDNRDELASALGIPPAEARALPDGAFALRAWQRWGERCPERLLGAFALAVWDLREQRLWAATDHLAEHNLYLHRGPAAVTLASSIPVVLAGPGVPSRVNVRELANRLIDLPEPTATCLDGVEHLAAGHALTVGGGEVRIRPWWRPEPVARLRIRDPRELHERLRNLLERAVADRLRSARPVGSFCSGGLDSTTVTALAARRLARQGGRITAYTSRPSPDWHEPARPNWENDDWPYVSDLAALHPNLDAVPVPPDGRTFLDLVDDVMDRTGAPFRNTGNLTWFAAIHDRAAEQGIGVLLTGASGNATASWSGRALLPELARRGRIARLLTEARARSRSRGMSLPALLREELVSPLVPAAVISRRELRRLGGEAPWSARAALAPAFAAELGLDPLAVAASYRLDFDAVSIRRRVLAPLGAGGLPGDGLAASHGLVHRDPLGDLRVQELCLAVPEIVYRAGGRDRLLLREATAGLLPDSVRLRTTRGEQAPDDFAHMTARLADLRATLAEVGTSETVRHVLDVPALERALRDWPAAWSPDFKLPMFRICRALSAGMFVRWVEARTKA